MTTFISQRAKMSGFPIPWYLGFVRREITLAGDIYAVRPYHLVLRLIDRLIHWLIREDHLRFRDLWEVHEIDRHDFLYWDYGVLFRLLTWIDRQTRPQHYLVTRQFDWFVITRDDFIDMLDTEAKEFAQSEYWRGKHEKQQALIGMTEQWWQQGRDEALKILIHSNDLRRVIQNEAATYKQFLAWRKGKGD